MIEFNSDAVHPIHRPYWKRAHHDWRFWTALVLMLAAMLYYILSDNFAMRSQMKAQPTSSSVGK